MHLSSVSGRVDPSQDCPRWFPAKGQVLSKKLWRDLLFLLFLSPLVCTMFYRHLCVPEKENASCGVALQCWPYINKTSCNLEVTEKIFILIKTDQPYKISLSLKIPHVEAGFGLFKLFKNKIPFWATGRRNTHVGEEVKGPVLQTALGSLGSLGSLLTMPPVSETLF